jgi:hypothetical protein
MCALMAVEQRVSARRHNQSAGSAAFCHLNGRFDLAEDARRGNHELATVENRGNVGSIAIRCSAQGRPA